MIYIFVLLYVIYLIYRYDIRKVKYVNNALLGFKMHYYFLLVVIVSIVGFSYRLGMDTASYMEYFESVDPDICYTFFHLSERRFEPIPELLFSSCKSISNDFTLVQFVIALFVNSIIFWFLRKHSPLFFFSVFLYFIFLFWNLNFEIKRESIAICIFLIALDSILIEKPKKKDYIKYYVICSIATLAHRFAFITFLYPLLLGIKFSKLYILLFSGMTIVLILWSSIVSDFFSAFNVVLALSSGESIQEYLDSDRFGTGGISIFGVFNKIVIPLIIVYTAKTGINRKIYSLVLVYFVVSLLMTHVFIFYRITNYLLIFLFLVYANSLKLILSVQNRTTIPIKKKLMLLKNKSITSRNNPLIFSLLLFVICFHIVTLAKKEEHIRYLPYSSVFTKELNKERETFYNNLEFMLHN